MNVLFSDESRFGLVSDDYRERVWRERGGQNRLATAIGVTHYRGGTQVIKQYTNKYSLTTTAISTDNSFATASGIGGIG
nr:unnamed protein product [Callosobruchus chinensis]